MGIFTNIYKIQTAHYVRINHPQMCIYIGYKCECYTTGTDKRIRV